MFTGDVVMDDDSNLNKNEFTALVSFAVNFHISHAQLVLSDLSLQCSEEGRRLAAALKGKAGEEIRGLQLTTCLRKGASGGL